MVPKGWEQQPIGAIATLINGRAYKLPEMLSQGVPILRIQNLKGGDNWYYSDLKLPDEKYCSAGDLLFAWSATFGPFLWRGPKAIYHYHIWKVLPGPSVEKHFLYHSLDGMKGSVKGQSQGGLGMLHMTKKGMEEWPVVLPPLPEQRKIAAILTAVDETIEKTEAVIAQLGVVKKAMMQELLTRGLPGRHTRFKKTELGEIPEEWEVVSLGQLSTLITKGESPKWQGFAYQSEGVLFVTSENVRERTIRLDPPKFIPHEFSEKLRRSRLESGDLLVNIVGASIGRAALWDTAYPEANINQAVALVRVDTNRVRPQLMLEAVYSAAGQAYLGLSAVDNARPNVSLGSLRSFPMPVPALDEQDEICSAAVAADERLLHERAVLARLAAAKSALMSVLLTGELRVTPDEDAA